MSVAKGDLGQKIVGVKAQGEMKDLVDTINGMIDKLSLFSREVTRVARKVGLEGELGVQAKVVGIEGEWKEIT